MGRWKPYRTRLEGETPVKLEIIESALKAGHTYQENLELSGDSLGKRIRERRNRRLSVPPNTVAKQYFARRINITESIISITRTLFQDAGACFYLNPSMVNTMFDLTGEDKHLDAIRLAEAIRLMHKYEISEHAVYEMKSITTEFDGLKYRVNIEAAPGEFSMSLSNSKRIGITINQPTDIWGVIKDADLAQLSLFTYFYFKDQVELLTKDRGPGERIFRFLPVFSSKQITDTLWESYGSMVIALNELQRRDSTKRYSIKEIAEIARQIEEGQ